MHTTPFTTIWFDIPLLPLRHLYWLPVPFHSQGILNQPLRHS